MIARRCNERRLAFSLTLLAAATLAACGGGGGGDDGDPGEEASPDTGSDPSPGETPAGTLVPGDIARYGIVTVSDADGEATDVVAGFFELSDAVAPEAFGGAFDPATVDCSVTDATTMDFATVTDGFIAPDAVEATSVPAGETVVLTSGAGTWLELQPGSVADFAFYDVPAGGTLPQGGVPVDLGVDVPGSEAFPAFESASFPPVSPLAGFEVDAPVTPDSRFTWRPGTVSGTKVRISTATAGAFFAGTGSRVSCTVPDTGSFSFPADVRDALGTDFTGEPVGAGTNGSRIGVDTRSVDDALLILVRESEAL